MKALSLTPEYRETVKFRTWMRLFFDIKNKDTFGNATQSALKAYNTENYNSASVIGHKNIRKAKLMSVTIADQMGFGFADLMKIGFKKMLEGDFEDWERMMTRLGYFDKEEETEKVVNVQAIIQNWVEGRS